MERKTGVTVHSGKPEEKPNKPLIHGWRRCNGEWREITTSFQYLIITCVFVCKYAGRKAWILSQRAHIHTDVSNCICRKSCTCRVRHNPHTYTTHIYHTVVPYVPKNCSMTVISVESRGRRISLRRSCRRQTLVPLFPPAKWRLQLLWLDNTWTEPLTAWQKDRLTLFTCKTS